MHSRHFLGLLTLASLALASMFFAACSSESSSKETPVGVNSTQFKDRAGVRDSYQSWTPTKALEEEGYTLFQTHCQSCHSLHKGAPASNAPVLSDMGLVYKAKYSSIAEARTWLHNKIVYAQIYKGINHQGYSALMPSFERQLSEDQVRALVAMLTFKD